MDQDVLHEALFALKDAQYQKMQRRLIPNIPPETIIGVRTPELRRLAKEIEDRDAFKKCLPHHYFEENQLHCFLLETEKDFDTVISDIEAFLPYIDNWATCDQLKPKVFRKNQDRLYPHVYRWITSEHPYEVRFGIGTLMNHYLDDVFDPAYPALVASVQMEDYYVKMMVAWYFATALAKQYDIIFPYISSYRLETWTHNKTIQKAIESYRLSAEQKQQLKLLRKK